MNQKRAEKSLPKPAKKRKRFIKRRQQRHKKTNTGKGVSKALPVRPKAGQRENSELGNLAERTSGTKYREKANLKERKGRKSKTGKCVLTILERQESKGWAELSRKKDLHKQPKKKGILRVARTTLPPTMRLQA